MIPASTLRLRDLREGGRWGLAQSVKNGLVYAAIRAALALVGMVPPRLLRALGERLGSLLWLAHRPWRAIARSNVRRVMPDLDDTRSRALLAAAYRNLGGHLGDAVAALRPGAPASTLPFPAEAREVLSRAQGEGKGVLFVSAHLGPWERVAATLVANGFPLTTVARESYDPRLTSLYDRLRGARGVQSIYRGAPGAAFRMLRTLRRGGILGMPMDLRSRVPSIGVPFLGAPAATPIGPARLACRTGAAVVVATPAPGPAAHGRQGAMILTATRIFLDDLASGPEPEARLTERINAELSRRILALPEQWVWMHPRWEPINRIKLLP